MDTLIENARMENARVENARIDNARVVYDADPRTPSPVAAPLVYGYGLPARSSAASLSSYDLVAGLVAIVMICGPLAAGAFRAI